MASLKHYLFRILLREIEDSLKFYFSNENAKLSSQVKSLFFFVLFWFWKEKKSIPSFVLVRKKLIRAFNEKTILS